MIFSLLLPMFICVLLIAAARQLTLSERGSRLVQYAVGYSFGIYLFHVMAIFLMRRWLDSYLDMWALILLMATVSIAVSIGITALLRKCRLGFIIGE